MKRTAAAIVVLGLAVAIATGIAFGFDARSLIYLGLMMAVGVLAIGVAARTDKRTVGPATCVQCEGLISPNAPYCKHCGADQPGSGPSPPAGQPGSAASPPGATT